MRFYIKLLGIILAVSFFLPLSALAAKVHDQACNACHRMAGVNPRNITNLCTPCHTAFGNAKASNALGSHPNPPVAGTLGAETVHYWGGSATTQLAAGSTNPTTALYTSRYSTSRNRVTCTICHDPHLDVNVKPQLLRAAADGDLICRQCHTNFYQDFENAVLTHPVGTTANYAAALLAAPEKYKPVPADAAPGIVGLVNGVVSCSSCHAPHFADSDSSTSDGLGNVSTLAAGDGHLLKANGPAKADNSLLCQTCHTYLPHGKMSDGGESVGCLTCHSGHIIVGNSNFFVLRNSVTTATFGTKAISYGAVDTPWNDNTPVSATGYCEVCHGSAETIPKNAGFHLNTERCSDCHKHFVEGGTYSFQNDANAQTCGDCHGFPPYLNVPGDDKTWPENKGGYAYKNASHNYLLDAGFKDETKTPHNTHAAGGTTQAAVTDYRFGAGIVACDPCHNGLSELSSHDTAINPGSYQDTAWNSLSTADSILSPAYKTNIPNQWTCSNTYCHSNGGKRNAGGTKVLADYATVITPSWLNGSNPRTLIGVGGECAACHGNTAVTMASGQRNNSNSHQKHLGTGTFAKNYSCNACHSQTATTPTALSVSPNARLVKDGGKHVNGTADVIFNSAFSLGVGTLGTGAYNGGANGTCLVYCHSDGKGTLYPADWDLPASGACGTCHGTTSATLTTGSHVRHIDASKGKVKCSSCHGTGADTGTHAGHVDGAITKLTVATSCDTCHGIENSAAWDVSPVWGNGTTLECRTCHTGAVITTYQNTSLVTITAPAKAVALSKGHNLSAGNYPLTGNPAGAKSCNACHTSIGTGHVDGMGNGDLLIGGFSCESCHVTGGARTAEATVKVTTHANTDPTYTGQKRADFSKVCLGCHDPHGTTNIGMVEATRTVQNLKDVSGNYAGNVTFTAHTSTNSFDEADAANLDDLCATCHTTTAHNNRTATGAHHEGESCVSCHAHDGAFGGFMPTGGTACNDCHGNPPSASDNRPLGKGGAHAAHVSVSSHLLSEDKFDCEVCHPGASTFDFSHSDGSVALAAGITNGTCANACHKSEVADGSWTDNNGLGCNACHYWSATPTSGGNVTTLNSEALSNNSHNKHFDSNKACIACHPDNGTDTMAPHIHIDDHEAYVLNSTNDGSVVTDRANATQDEATVNVASWNDRTNTCSNAACHNPSGLSNSATWGNTNAVGCNFCHSSTNPDSGKTTSGSHGPHMNAAGTFGITTIACTSCHPNNTLNGHLNGTVDLNGGFSYSASLTDYTSATFGRCTTTTCHNNGRGTAVQTPVWGTASADCTICHNNGSGQPYPTNGRHAKHVANTAYVNSSCGSCHPNATSTVIATTTHINGSRNTGVSVTSFTSPTCVNTCHLVDATGTWTDANTLDCIECHNSGKSAGGALPTSGLHAGILTISGNTHDNSFKVTKGEVSPSGTCITCHTATPSTGHKTGTLVVAEVTTAATVGYIPGATPTCGPNGTLVNCHDDKGAWKRRWSTTAQNSNGTQCGNCHGNFDLTWVTGVGQRHSNDAQLHGSHDGIDDCYICHTYKAGDTTFYNLATNHRDGNIQLNTNMSFTDDGATVHCTGCHTTPLGLGDGQYSFQDTYNGDGADGGLNRWGRSIQAGPDANCNACHVTNGMTHSDTNESASVHTYHTGSPMSPGCGACHLDSGPGGANHQNGTVNFGGTYLTAALNYTGAFTNTNCSTANGCHNSDAGSWVADSLATCEDCHTATGKLLYQGSVFPPNSAAHTKHINNNSYVGSTPSNDCDDCHGVGSSSSNHLATHNDGIKTLINKVTVWDAGTGTCTNNCHTVVDGRDWTSGTPLACADCHAAAKLKAYLTAYPPSTAKHLQHINNNFYVPGDCADCHGLNSGNGTHAGHKNNVVENSVTYATGTQTCTITCHVANTTGDWTNGGALACIDCHAGGRIGTAAASGLHAGTLTISANTHDDSFRITKNEVSPSGTCVTCHTSTPSNAHKTGTLSGAQANFAAAINELGGATPTCGPNGALVGCHTDKGVWKRKWSTTAKNSNGTECGNCHGTFTTGFTTGIVARHQTTTSGDTGGQIAANHDATDQCYVCHTYKAGDTTYYNFASKHRDNSIQINNAVGFTDNGATVGCTGCHVATGGTGDGGHEFTDTSASWTRAPQAGPSANCNDCHNTNGRTHLGTNESVTIHLLHEGSTLFAGSCEACHANSRPGGANHNNGTVNFGGTYLTTAVNYTGSDFTNTNCSTANGCHDSDNGEWAAGTLGADKCTDCHTSGAKVLSQLNAYPPVSGKHTVHSNNNIYVGVAAASDCDACHGSNAYLGTHTGHRNGSKTVAASVSLYTSGSGTCTNTCHIADTIGDWTNGTVHLVCADCHGAARSLNAGGETDMSITIGPNAGQHDKHMLNTAYVGGGCVDCHGHSGAIGVVDNHLNGPDVNTITVATKVSVYNSGTGTCTNTCHNVVDTRDWLAGVALNCADCHAATGKSLYVDNSLSGYPVTSGKHARHNAAYSSYVPNTCAACHGANAATGAHAGHKNGVLDDTVSYVSGTQTCTNTCHLANTTGDWTSGAVHLACIDCHSGTYRGKANKNHTSGLHQAVNATAHDENFGTGGTCTSCHTGMDVAGDLPSTHVDGNTVQPNTAYGLFVNYSTANGNCTANCHRDNGQWKRKWIGATDAAATGAPGNLVCNNCHGQYSSLTNSTGWNDGTVHFRSGSGAGENKGDGHTDASPNQCQDCHGYPAAGSHNSNNKIDFSGGGTTYTLNWGTNGTQPGWYCSSCHAQTSDDATSTSSHTFLDSLAFPSPTRATPENIVYVTGTTTPSGTCTSCHGNEVNGSFWPDSTNGNTMNEAGHHYEHVHAIAKKMVAPAAPTVEDMNVTCNFCHPGNTHGGANGVEPADVSMTDTNNDGTADAETGTKFKRIISPFAADNTGIWRSTPKTCSNVACHANAPYTPHWYSDGVAPGNVTDLVAAANTEPGTVMLNWTSPGNDGALDGTAYRYDLRFSTASISDANFAAASQAKVPKVDRMGKAQTSIVNGLTPGTTYYFALKTYDESGNVSALSNVVSRAAQIDNVAPIFWGISSVSVGDESYDMAPNPDTNSVYVKWDAGRDHSHGIQTPLNYVVMWSEYSLRTHFSKNGAMPTAIGTDACFNSLTTPPTLITCGTGGTSEYRIKSGQTTALGYNVTGLPVGTVYNFLVRAKDLAGNVDSNRVDLMAMAKSTPYKTIALQTQRTSATIPTTSTGWSGLPGGSTSASDAALGAAFPGTAPGTFSLAQNAVVVWSPATTYSVKTNVWGLNYQIKITGNTNGATTLTYQFGYLTGKAFTGLGTAKTMTIARRALARVIKFPLTTFKGAIPAGSEPAFVLKNTTASAYSVTLTYGSVANKGGILLYNEQEYNDLPTGLGGLTQTTVNSTFVGGNIRRLTWNAAIPVNAGQTVHYDVFGSIDNGVTWPYVIGRNLTTTTVDWDPVGDGITGNRTQVKFRVMAGDGYRSGTMLVDTTTANNLNHSVVDSAAFTVDNSVDIWTPAAITTLTAETRPKQGGVYLSWRAVGNDGFNHGTRATQYDIRYNTAVINDANWAASTPATNEPYPDFTGAVEGYELLGLNVDAPYYFAMKVGDQIGNWSPLSNVVTTQSGPKCGICHSTPPDEPVTAGKHSGHGYTKHDCGDCHGTAAADFAVDHQDGVLKLGYKTATPYPGIIAGSRLYYTTDGTSGGAVIYDDTSGAGGFVNTGGDQIDNGTCSGFNAAGATGCHGPATPSWNAAATLACSACHGLSTRTTDTYGRQFDATLDNADVVPDEIHAAPPLDNHGGSTGKYVGAHLKHLNSSFRLAKGDNCKLCHLDSLHADGTVDVAYDLNVTGAGALWTPNATGVGTPGTCGGTSVDNCHGSNVPSWDSAATVACVQCHGFAGVNPAHMTDASTVRACTWCHPAGHPQGTVQDPNSIMIPNNPLVGIAYRSGGIHLLKNINGRGEKTTEAEVCWTCHDAQGTKISEWGQNIDTLTGSSPYNYGNLFTAVGFTGATSNWLGLGTGAYWQSGTSAFQTIKKGKIQSTHSTNPGGTSTVAYDSTNKRYNETLDAVADLRCSNCHDVHNMNKAPDDTATGTPYLRGTWMGNPYNEDGPPVTTTTYVNVSIGSYGFGAIPRGGTGYRRLGGYFIDQNNVVPGTATATTMATLDDYPTAGWTQESSAGLCILCHGNDVDNMDQKSGESLWLGTNGHSNSAIGGTFTNSANIFVNLTGGLTGLPTPVGTTSTLKTTQVPDMAYQMQPNTTTTTRGYGYRGTTGTSDAGGYNPRTATLYAHYAYDWGATIDSSTTDQMYHQFSCSKCHNPHASRLPKLLITNCLDVQHNTWSATSGTAQSAYTAAALTDVDRGWKSAYYASAQNCHRYNNLRTAANKGGWNKVSPWTTANQ